MGDYKLPTMPLDDTACVACCHHDGDTWVSSVAECRETRCVPCQEQDWLGFAWVIAILVVILLAFAIEKWEPGG